MYLAPIIIGIAAMVYPGMFVGRFFIDLLGISSKDFSVVLVSTAAVTVTFVLFAGFVVVLLILTGQISAKDGWRMMAGRGVPAEWYR